MPIAQPRDDEVEAELELFMAVAALCIVAAARRRVKAEPEGAAVERKTRMRGPAFWGKRVMLYVQMALCLTIPSGWTQQVLDEFQARRDVASQVVTICGSERSYLTRKGRPSASGAQ